MTAWGREGSLARCLGQGGSQIPQGKREIGGWCPAERVARQGGQERLLRLAGWPRLRGLGGMAWQAGSGRVSRQVGGGTVPGSVGREAPSPPHPTGESSKPGPTPTRGLRRGLPGTPTHTPTQPQPPPASHHQPEMDGSSRLCRVGAHPPSSGGWAQASRHLTKSLPPGHPAPLPATAPSPQNGPGNPTHERGGGYPLHPSHPKHHRRVA